MLKKLPIQFLQTLILGVLGILLSVSHPVQGTELVKVWGKAISSGDDDLIKAINSLTGDADELENVLRHVDDIDAAGGYLIL